MYLGVFFVKGFIKILMSWYILIFICVYKLYVKVLDRVNNVLSFLFYWNVLGNNDSFF